MAKQRLAALDGLRGFAALSVVISHIGINLEPIVAVPLVNFFYRMISSGTSAVQLFFVLSGFLMAYLYPQIQSNYLFLSKRYLRLMPVLATVIFYIWWTQQHASTLIGNLLALPILALAVHFIWRLLRSLSGRIPNLGRLIFYGFILFQIIFLVFSLTLLPRLDLPRYPVLAVLSNLSLTMYLLKKPLIMSGVFWTLVPELLFYFVYPFLAVFLLNWLDKKPRWVSILLALLTVKVLFDLDMASRSFYSLHAIFINRGTGFLVGVILGRMYLNQRKLWRSIEKFLAKPVISLLVLILFFSSLGWEWPDRVYQIRQYASWHYLALSFIFGLTMAAGLVKKSLVSRLFSQKALVFLGTISLSLFLLHGEVIKLLEWSQFWQQWSWLPVDWLNLAKIVVSVGLSLVAAFILYWLIERQYFMTRIKEVKTKPGYFLWLPLVLIGGVVGLVFAGDYSPTTLMSRQSLKLDQNGPYQFSLQAKHPNLSVVWLSLDYARDPSIQRDETSQNVQLVFKLFDENNQELFVSSRSPLQLEGQPQYPFGFPPFADSEGKNYRVELDLVNAHQSDELFINKGQGVVSQYVTQKSLRPEYIAQLLYYRLVFTLQSLSY